MVREHVWLTREMVTCSLQGLVELREGVLVLASPAFEHITSAGGGVDVHLVVPRFVNGRDDEVIGVNSVHLREMIVGVLGILVQVRRGHRARLVCRNGAFEAGATVGDTGVFMEAFLVRALEVVGQGAVFLGVKRGDALVWRVIGSQGSDRGDVTVQARDVEVGRRGAFSVGNVHHTLALLRPCQVLVQPLGMAM